MGRPRLVGLLLVLLAAIGAVAVPSVFASEHGFKMLPMSSKTFSVKGGGLTLTAGTNVISCLEVVGSGEVTQMDAVGKLRIRFKKCKGANGGPSCTVKSVGAPDGEVVLETLKGQFGTVKGNEAASGVGLLLSPETGAKILVLAANNCLPETSVNGSFAGEVTPTSKLQSTSKVIFDVTAGAQKIKTIAVLGAIKTPELEMFGLPATDVGVFDLTFHGGPIEIV